MGVRYMEVVLWLLFFVSIATFVLCQSRKRAFYRWFVAEGILSFLFTMPVMFFNLILPYSFELSAIVFLSFWCFFGLIGLGLIYILPVNISYRNFQYANRGKKEYCPHCREPVPPDANYCKSCNNAIARTYDYDTL